MLIHSFKLWEQHLNTNTVGLYCMKSLRQEYLSALFTKLNGTFSKAATGQGAITFACQPTLWHSVFVDNRWSSRKKREKNVPASISRSTVFTQNSRKISMSCRCCFFTGKLFHIDPYSKTYLFHIDHIVSATDIQQLCSWSRLNVYRRNKRRVNEV